MLPSNLVARIALVKPEKARGVEDVILRAAQTGQITDKVYQSSLWLQLLSFLLQVDLGNNISLS